jgi:hypothetical protein
MNYCIILSKRETEFKIESRPDREAGTKSGCH